MSKKAVLCWLPHLAGLPLSVNLSIPRRRNFYGNRLILVERAQWSRNTHEVVKVVGRLCTGEGFTGPRLTLTVRKEFAGTGCGVPPEEMRKAGYIWHPVTAAPLDLVAAMGPPTPAAEVPADPLAPPAVKAGSRRGR